MQMTLEQFNHQKNQVIQGVDLSRKGCVDDAVKDIVKLINDKPEYFTTSSCSGRALVFCENLASNNNKKGCKWLYSTHEDISELELLSHTDPNEGDIILKYEPLILHVQCLNLEHAKAMYTCAIDSGFRNSGITIGKHGKIVLAIRGCIGMEVPLSEGGELLVPQEYLRFLCRKGNKKIEENRIRTQRLHNNLKILLSG